MSPAFMHLFSSKISFRFLPFSNPTVVVEGTSIEKALNANECVK